MSTTYSELYLKEFEAEVPASRKCVERIPENLFDYKPHEKSMKLGYLTLLVSEIPKWLQISLEENVIDFATYKHFEPKTTAEMVKHFDENVELARKTLKNATEESFKKEFTLKNNDQIIMKIPVVESISSTINHWVHHRGQLTVYMRLNNIAVPSIYGPSADDRSF